MTLEDITRTESNLKDRLTDYISANYDLDLIQEQCKAHIILDLLEHLNLIEQSENVSKAIFESVCNAVIQFEGMKVATKRLAENPDSNPYALKQFYVKWQINDSAQIESESKKINIVWTCPRNGKSGKWANDDKDILTTSKIETKNWASMAKKLKVENNHVTFLETDEVWYYDVSEGIYKPHGDKMIAKQCQKLINSCDTHTVYEIINTIRRSTYISSASLLESIISNTQNGILDTNTFEVKPHSPEYLSTTKLPFSINHNARNLKLWNHILSIIDPYDINKFMEMLVDFDFSHHNTIYSIVSMMICNFLTNNMTSFINITPFTHNFYFFLISHKVSALIMNLRIQKEKSMKSITTLFSFYQILTFFRFTFSGVFSSK